MDLTQLASAETYWQGYNDYKAKRVIELHKASLVTYRARLKDDDHIYDTLIHLDKLTESRCTCPEANGRPVICKHMVAAYLAIPDADETEDRHVAAKHFFHIQRLVDGMSEDDRRKSLISYMMQDPQYKK